MQMSDLAGLPLEATQLHEVAEMLRDIRKVRVKSLGEEHVSVAEAACVLCLLYICLHDALQAGQSLQEAQHVSQKAVSNKLDAMLSTAREGLQFVTSGL